MKLKPHDGAALQEFMRRLNCFEASDLWQFFEKVRGKKIEFDDWRDDVYVRGKVEKFTENPFQWFMSLDTNCARQFWDFIMYEWGGNWEEIYEKRKEELQNAKGMTREMLEAVGLESAGSSFLSELEEL